MLTPASARAYVLSTFLNNLGNSKGKPFQRLFVTEPSLLWIDVTMDRVQCVLQLLKTDPNDVTYTIESAMSQSVIERFLL